MTDTTYASLGKARADRQQRGNSLLSNSLKLGESLISSIGPETIGFKPSPSLSAWRDSHPVLGFTSNAVGLGVALVGFGKIPLIRNLAIKGAAKVGRSNSRFIPSVLKTNRRVRKIVVPAVITETSFEAARQVTALAIGNKTFSEALWDTGVNTTIGVGVAGTFGALSTTVGAGARRNINALAGPIDPAPQLKLRALYAKAEEVQKSGAVGTGFDPQQVQALSGSYVQTILRRKPINLNKYINSTSAIGKSVNSLLKDSIGYETWLKQPSLIFDQKPTSISGKASLARQLLGLEDNRVFQFLDQARILTSDTPLDSKFTKSLNAGKIGNGYLIPIPEGNFFVLRKAQTADKEAKKKDVWVAFKTDNPGVFFPQETLATKKAIDENFAQSANPNYAEITNGNALATRTNSAIDNVQKLFPTIAGNPNKLEKIFTKLDPGLKNFFGDTFDVFSQAYKNYFSPSLFRWDHNSSLGALSASAQMSADMAQQATFITLHGTRRSAALGSSHQFALGATIVGRGQQEGGLANEVKKILDLGDDVWQDYQQHLNARTPTPELERLVKEGDLDPQILRVLDIRENEFNSRIHAMNKINRFFGLRPFSPVQFHRGGRRDRPGDFVQRIYIPTPDGQNRIAYFISGNSRKETDDKARSIVEKLRSEGEDVSYIKGEAQLKGEPNYDVGAGFQQDFDINARNRELLNHPVAQRIEFLNEEFGLANRAKSGFDIPGYEALNFKQDIQALGKNLGEFDNMIAYLTYRMRFNDAFDGLRAIDGRTFDEFDAFIKQQFKRNDAKFDDGYLVNAVKEPINKLLGNNFVRKVGSISSSFVHFTTFAGNLNYMTMQVASVLNTIVPQFQYLTRAPIEELSRYYSHYPIINRLTNQVGTAANTPSLPEIIQDTFKVLRNPDEQMNRLLNRANSNGVFNPQFQREIDDVLTPDSSSLLKGIADSSDPVEAMKQMLLLPASASEQFQRISAFTMMASMLKRLNVAGKRLDGANSTTLSDDDIFDFASQFVSNTMYQYQATRRARIFSGTLSPLGLFKNWTLHNLGQAFSYYRLGWKQGDWAPLMSFSAMVGATGGLRAMPFWGVGKTFLNFVHDEDVYQNFLAQNEDEDLGSSMMFYGLPALTGAVLTSNLESPLTDLDSLTNTFTNFALFDKATQVGDVIGSGFDQLQRGESLGTSPEFKRKFTGAFAPRAVLRAINATSGEYLKSQRTGNPVAPQEKFNSWMYGLGFNPVGLQKIYETRQEIWKSARKRKAVLSHLTSGYVDAQLKGDNKEMSRFLGIATAAGIPLDNFMRSANRKLQVQQPINLKAILSQIDRVAAEQVLAGEGAQNRAGY